MKSDGHTQQFQLDLTQPITVLILDHNHKLLHMFQIRESSVNPAQFYKTSF